MSTFHLWKIWAQVDETYLELHMLTSSNEIKENQVRQDIQFASKQQKLRIIRMEYLGLASVVN